MDSTYNEREICVYWVLDKDSSLETLSRVFIINRYFKRYFSERKRIKGFAVGNKYLVFCVIDDDAAIELAEQMLLDVPEATYVIGKLPR